MWSQSLVKVIRVVARVPGVVLKNMKIRPPLFSELQKNVSEPSLARRRNPEMSASNSLMQGCRTRTQDRVPLPTTEQDKMTRVLLLLLIAAALLEPAEGQCTDKWKLKKCTRKALKGKCLATCTTKKCKKTRRKCKGTCNTCNVPLSPPAPPSPQGSPKQMARES